MGEDFQKWPHVSELSVCICYEDSLGKRYCLLIRNKSNRKGNELKCGPAEFLAFKSLPVVCHLLTSLLYWSVQNAKWGQSRCIGLGVSGRLPVVCPIHFPNLTLP